MNKRKLLISWLAILGAAVLVFGCNGTKEKTATGDTATTTTTGTPGETTGDTGKEPPKYTSSDVPAELKKDAFEYYGMGSDKDVAVVLTKSSDSMSHPGTQEMRIKELADGSVRYSFAYVGDIATVFSQSGELEVRDDGVWAVSVNGVKVDPAYMELPNDLTPGKSWSVKTRMQMPTDKEPTVISMTRKIVGTQKVTTKAGEFDALYVSDTGTITKGIEKRNVSLKTWFVKGKGMVKTVLSSTGQNPETYTIEATE